MNTATDTMIVKTPKSSGGSQEGQSATDLVGFYGATPVVQPTSANQAAIAALTDASGGAGAYTNGILTITGTYNSTILANAIATLAKGYIDTRVLVNQIRSDLVTLGILKGS